MIDVSMMTTQELNNNIPMPVCRYDILRAVHRQVARWSVVTGYGPVQGEPVRFARIGDAVYHKWSCTAEVANLYCMRVHTCLVTDGQGGPNIQVLDNDG